MSTSQKTIVYQRKQAMGTLTLHGSVDIFEATLLYTTVQRAIRDHKATTICLDFAEVERLDVSAAQLLLTLRRDVEATGRLFVLGETVSLATKMLAPMGISLQP